MQFLQEQHWRFKQIVSIDNFTFNGDHFEVYYVYDNFFINLTNNLRLENI